MCVYVKMVLKITEETWGKSGITTVKYYNKKRYNWTMAKNEWC